MKIELDVTTEDGINLMVQQLQEDVDTLTMEDLSQPDIKSKVCESYVVLGIFYEFSERKSQAIKAYDAALKIDESHVLANAFKKTL